MKISDYISIASVLIALIALVKSFFTERKIKRQQYTINKFIIEKNKKENEDIKKSCVVAIPYKSKIAIQNTGIATARNIRIEWNGLDKERGVVHINTEMLPYAMLNTNESFYINLILADGQINTKTIKIIWDDEYMENNSREQAISLD